ncbi:MAG: TonB-dependent receptor [Cytophagales bacterium]|nr:TonB-dependent receptor [Cytophagales bacterium]MDW8383527.1 TonB-dependent receptor [Flammeovirgaceae bacterium]
MKFSLRFILLIWSIQVYSQNILTGTVKTAANEPIVGAVIAIRETNQYTVSDIDGNFTLKTKETPPFTLFFSMVGYKSEEVEIYEISELPLEIILREIVLESATIIASREFEDAQEIPVPISVMSGASAEEAGAFNVNRLKELVPSVQLYSSNPRNTTLNIRGLGTTFGFTNDGLDPGVGFYIDGVYYARPAVTSLDFVDVEQIEVLRGPQGFLFGKNTTAGAFSVSTRKPEFVPSGNVEVSYGNFHFLQAKTSITGGITEKIAGRLSFSGTRRNGLLYNELTQQDVNELSNLGIRGQLLFVPSNKVEVLVIGDINRQRPQGYAQLYAGTVPTMREPYQQFENIISDLNYQPIRRNAFERIIDHNTPWRAHQDLGGVSINTDIIVGKGKISSISAWRFWNWIPSNDRDFLGLDVLRKSEAPSRQEQYSQEIRYKVDVTPNLNVVAGVFVFYQSLKPIGAHIEEGGKDLWRFVQNNPNTSLWKTPGLLEGYGIRSYPIFDNLSSAFFTQFEWKITEKLNLLPAFRLNYDAKKVSFKRETYGGLQTNNPQLLAIKNSVYTNQFFEAQNDDINYSAQLTTRYQIQKNYQAYLTYSTGFKPIGINLGGLPTQNGQPLIELATIQPERVHHIEGGIKTKLAENSMLNLTIYQSDVRNFQTLVQSPEPGVNRGYLANADRVRVQGAELDVNMAVLKNKWSVYGAVSYTDGRYVSFTNAPRPLEETGHLQPFKDVSGGELPGISRWAGSIGTEFTQANELLNHDGKLFLAIETFYRSRFSSSPSPSKYLNINAYSLINARLGFRATKGISVFVWGRNLLNQNYFEQLLPGFANAGYYVAVVGDQRTYGITIKHQF